jgi:hypothetical protein
MYYFVFHATFNNNNTVRAVPFTYYTPELYNKLAATHFNISDTDAETLSLGLEIPLGQASRGTFSKEVQKRRGKTEIIWDSTASSTPFSPQQQADADNYNNKHPEAQIYTSEFVLTAKSFKVETIEDVTVFGFEEFFAALSSAFTAAGLFIACVFPADVQETRHFLFGDKGADKILRRKNKSTSAPASPGDEKDVEHGFQPKQADGADEEAMGRTPAKGDEPASGDIQLRSLGAPEEQAGSALQDEAREDREDRG